MAALGASAAAAFGLLALKAASASELEFSSTSTAEIGGHQPLIKRAHLNEDTPPLKNDQILDHIFGFVGVGDYAYTAGVCRKWRGRYITLCHRHVTTLKKRVHFKKNKLRTTYRNAVVTAARLQLALKSSAKVSDMETQSARFAHSIVQHSLEPIAVLCLAKLHDLKWTPHRTELCVRYNKLELLQWLREHGCPWDAQNICHNAALRGNVEMLQWLSTVTGPWSSAVKEDLMWFAGVNNELEAVKWLYSEGAALPRSFHQTIRVGNELVNTFWPARIVSFAVATSGSWGEWRCDRFAPRHYPIHMRRNAWMLCVWVHKHGCPCKCRAAPARAAAAGSS
jgi:Ankyrin repeats (many copies)